jgi:MFS transporter, ACS family, solute carrier family 17 (sodium-dependent inorganic phosphate cotransporter), other
VFAAFNCGSAFGLALAGGVIAMYGWQTVFGVFGVVGVVWAVSGFFLLPAAARKGPEKSAESGLGLDELESIQQKKENNFSRAKSTPPWMWSQLASLAWCHMCVNFGFFQLQSWLPAYLARDLGLTLGNSGLVAAFPWLVCAIFSFTSGKLADAAIRNGWERWKVRRGAMRVATVGPATALAGLSMLSASGAAGSVWATSLVVVLVTATLATQAVAIAGFHAYLQDVAPAKAGAFLGVTNTLGVFAGIAANVTTGVILEKTGKFTLVFLVTAFVYLSSGAVWERNMKGRVLFA